MISSAFQCGCPEQKSQHHNCADPRPMSNNLKSCTSFASYGTGCDESDQDSCGCGSDLEEETPEDNCSKVVSEIASKGLPYKEIEAIINDNRVVVRLQTEKPSKFDPPCECIEPKPVASETNSMYKGGNAVTFAKTKEHCRTINVYPHPDQKGADSNKDKFDKRMDFKKSGDTGGNVQLPTVNPEDNPNIFVLKIKRKCENGDKKHNLDLEFRTPRPWRCPHMKR